MSVKFVPRVNFLLDAVNKLAANENYMPTGDLKAHNLSYTKEVEAHLRE